jgi:toxin ParE1/3/4
VVVNWTARAKARLRAIHSRIAENAPSIADKEVDRLLSCSARLSELPRSGREVPEYSREDVRELLVRPYRLIYWILPDRIDVMTVLHYRQHLDKNFKD